MKNINKFIVVLKPLVLILWNSNFFLNVFQLQLHCQIISQTTTFLPFTLLINFTYIFFYFFDLLIPKKTKIFKINWWTRNNQVIGINISMFEKQTWRNNECHCVSDRALYTLSTRTTLKWAPHSSFLSFHTTLGNQKPRFQYLCLRIN